MGVAGEIFRLAAFLVRIAACVVASVAYERYWYTTGHLVGYLWFMNNFKASQNEIPKLYEDMGARFPLEEKVLVYTLLAILITFLLHKSVIRVSGLVDIVWTAFCLAQLGFWTRFPVKKLTGQHFYVEFYNAFFTGFLLFANLAILSARPGPRFYSHPSPKDKDQ